MTRIVLDAMGTDSHPTPEIEAALRAVEEWQDPLLLVGPEEQLRSVLAGHPGADRIQIVHAPEVLEMTDKPADSARGKAQSSMAVGMELIKQDAADAFVTSGNTGGAMANALFRLGRMRGVKRPALTPIFPTRAGRCVVLDIGANADVRPEFLAQFALLGSVYAQTALGIRAPRVALLSNGEEAGKGNELIKEAYPLVQATGVNFVGNVEPKELYAGAADVVVVDGFTGNVFLKTSEAVAALLIDMIREEIRAAPLSTFGGMLARPAFRRVATRLDPAEHGAALLLGVNGLVFIGHGRYQARGVFNAIRVARQAVAGGLLDSLHQAILERMETAANIKEEN